MSTRTGTGAPFDATTFTRAVESADTGTLVAQFDDGAELEMIDHRTPPSAPTVVHGKEAISRAMRDVFARDVTHEVLQCVVDGDHAAYTERCVYPEGNKVMSMTMLDLRDGRIVHQSTVQAWDEEPETAPEVGDFSAPDASDEHDGARVDTVHVGGHDMVRMTLEPGWRWSEHMRDVVGTDTCMKTHCAYMVSGMLRSRMEDGSEQEFRSGQVAAVPPGHDAWVVGDEPVVLIDWQSTA